ncbi:hypothetical protein [Methanolobus bombayensis]|uniref:hypothetical protein n=1 Tax=Methanolobus bombayensis TaxID=38023 RepID=UPI001AE694A0|nr:hypothetical protein [Methanolobus bombayensis]MBP1909021.1 tRNA(Ile2) C34 agmatinyltransferase TiaS [Methanolobus bombayensis]
MKHEDNLCCEFCRAELKRQLIGSNVFYYCKECGRITSAKDMVTIRINDNGAKICV